MRRSLTTTLAATGVGLLSLMVAPAVASADTPGYSAPVVLTSSGGSLAATAPSSAGAGVATAPAAGSASSVTAPASGLAFTGANVAETAAGGAIAIALGVGLVRVSRRRHSAVNA